MEEDVKAAKGRLTRVFSYGSNSTAQLRARVGAAHLDASPAVIYDWVRIFCMHSQNWAGSVASLVPMKGGEVRGAVVWLNAEQLQQLDSYERGYSKACLTASLPNEGSGTRGEEVEVVAYLAKDVTWTSLPSEGYLAAIHLMLREHWDMTAEPIRILACERNAAAATQGDSRAGEVAGVASVCMESATPCGAEVTPHPQLPPGVEVVDKAAPWRHPGAINLGIHALCVEINARLFASPWVMPRAAVEVQAALATIHDDGRPVTNAELLRAVLAAGEAAAEVRRALCAGGGEEEEVVEAARDVLGAHLLFTYGSLMSVG